ncbi:MCE family protein [Rhodococcus sp. X156]|uniref:MCE family protein n=1 Tax=Rhodococcus sp. X156 TaxID=2499145 RepID=UPI000FD9788A|nr:MCE family protein [Rhodococcus sp. X156]
MRISTKARTSAAAAVSAVLLSTGCGFSGLYGVPLPGGADLGANPYEVTVDFTDVLDLVPQSNVKVNDVNVGRVDSIDLAPDGVTAQVKLKLNGDVDLPANAIGSIDQTSLLGEKYVTLSPPQGEQATGKLGNGATIPLASTTRGTELEEVFGALSLLLNGGGVAQLQTITRELNSALSGREGEVRSLLEQTNILIGGLNTQRGEINRALDGLNTLSKTVDSQRVNLTTALDQLPAGVQTLDEQRPQLTLLLRQLDQLGVVATNVVNRSRDSLVADLNALSPTLRSLADSGDNLAKSLEILLTFPFTDAAIDTVAGNFVNLNLTADLNLGTIISNGVLDPTLLGLPALPLPQATVAQGAP